MNFEQYLQCPYCVSHKQGHGKRVPKTVGKYRVKIIGDNILIFKCAKCSRIFRYEVIPHMYLWEFMKKKERLEFKKTLYKS